MQYVSITNVIQKFERAVRLAMRRHQKLKPVAHWIIGKRYQARLEIAERRAKLGAKIAGSEIHRQSSSINPENLIWVFGIGRSGNTWLLGMMKDVSHYEAWNEPFVGRLFGDFYKDAKVQALPRAHFIMGEPIRKGWIRSIRNFVLDGAGYSNPNVGRGDYLVIGEHNSSVGAPLIMEALPESRMILLVRDPRDVIASNLDGAKKGGWLAQWREVGGGGDEHYHALAEVDPDVYVRQLAEKYLCDIGSAKQAYESHKGRKVLVRYEDLRADVLSVMRRIYSTLELPVNGEQLEHIVAAHSWENIPDKFKGRGQFNRKATPGAWKEDLTPGQARIVEEITAPLLKEFYPAP